MTKFKVGDKVRIVKYMDEDGELHPIEESDSDDFTYFAKDNDVYTIENIDKSLFPIILKEEDTILESEGEPLRFSPKELELAKISWKERIR